MKQSKLKQLFNEIYYNPKTQPEVLTVLLDLEARIETIEKTINTTKTEQSE